MTVAYNIVGVATFLRCYGNPPDYRRPSDRHYRRSSDCIVGVTTNYRRGSDPGIGGVATFYRRSSDQNAHQSRGFQRAARC